MMPDPVKHVEINNKLRRIRGVSADDPYFTGLYNGFEDQFASLCRRYVPPDAVCVDIGANIGITSLILSDCASRGRVLAVEPSPAAYKALMANVSENDVGNVTLLQCAVGDNVGLAKFVEASAYGFVSDRGIEVEITTLEALMTRGKLDRLDFLKIDVEGYEPVILRAAVDVLTQHQPVVYLEFNSWCLIGHSRQDPISFAEWLFDNFSEVFVVHKEGPVQLTRLSRSGIFSFVHDNMVKHGCVNDLLVTNAASRLQH